MRQSIGNVKSANDRLVSFSRQQTVYDFVDDLVKQSFWFVVVVILVSFHCPTYADISTKSPYSESDMKNSRSSTNVSSYVYVSERMQDTDMVTTEY